MAKTRLDEQIDVALERGIDIKNRIVYVIGEIDTGIARTAQIGLKLLDSKEGKITVHINSLGGPTHEGLAIYDSIKACRNEVTTIGSGAVMSIAAAIFQAGDHRILTPNSRFMVHNGSWSWEGETDRLNGVVKDLKLDNKIYHSILAARSGLPIGRIKTLCRQETYMAPDKALKLGFTDEIMG